MATDWRSVKEERVELRSDLIAELVLDTIEPLDAATRKESAKGVQVVGRVILDFRSRAIKKELDFVIRSKSGLVLLNAEGRVSLRQYAEEVFRRVLGLEPAFLPVYQEDIASLLKNVDCWSVTIAVAGDFEEYNPSDPSFDWRVFEQQPFVEARFRIPTKDESTFDVRLTSQTIALEAGRPSWLGDVATVLEDYLL
jgi:hypothetical protein